MNAHVVRARIIRCLGILYDLSEVWDPVGIYVESAKMSLVGHDGISERKLEMLERYARRWSRVDPRLRRMYCQHAEASEVARIALWQIMFARKPSIYGPSLQKGLEPLWVETHGYPSSIELVPIHHARKGEHNG